MFNIYTNDQPISTDSDVKHCIYVDDTAIVVQYEKLAVWGSIIGATTKNPIQVKHRSVLFT